MKKLVFVLLTIFLLCGCSKKEEYMPQTYTPSGNMSITFFDLEYGASVIIERGESTVLIGCGESRDFPKLYDYMRLAGISVLDAVILPNGKEAHTGGFQKVMANFKVKTVYVPSDIKDISKYKTLTDMLCANSFFAVNDGTEIYDKDGLYIDVLSSGVYNEEAFLTLYISYGDTSFLLEGDGDLVAERELILGVGELIEADVLSVPHCGSDYLPSDEFIETVNPTYAVIPVYGDGTPQLTLQRQLSQKVQKILRTDSDGTVTFVTDGKNIECHYSK